jgi:FG-GAP repeat
MDRRRAVRTSRNSKHTLFTILAERKGRDERLFPSPLEPRHPEKRVHWARPSPKRSIIMMKASMIRHDDDTNDEVELSSFRNYRPVPIRNSQEQQQWSSNHHDGDIVTTRGGGGHKHRWLQGVIVVAFIVLLIGILSPSAAKEDHPATAATPTNNSQEEERRIRHEVVKLVPPDETDFGHFGMMIVIPDETTVWIAAPSSSLTTIPDAITGNTTILQEYVGSIYGYDIGGTNQMELEVPSPDLVEHAWFGGSMAVSASSSFASTAGGGDNRLFVAAQGVNKVYEYAIVNDDSSSGAGAGGQQRQRSPQPQLLLQSTLFGRNNTNDTTLLDGFGTAVAYDGDYLIVGDAFAGGGTDYQSAYGRIHVYRRIRSDDQGTTSFEEIQTLEAPAPQHGEMFGATFTYRNDTLVVGDFLRTTPNGGENSGCVYIYQQQRDDHQNAAGTFTLIQTLYAADGGAEHEGFGASVALSDTILVVGLNDRAGRTIASLNGGAFVYRRYDKNTNDNDDDAGSGGITTGGTTTNTTWKFESLLLAHDQAITKGQFGGGVAVYGETIVVGSQEMDEVRAGKVYVFRKNTLTAKWEDIIELAPSDPSEGHHFGRVVAIHNTTVVVGAFMDSELQEAGGSAYIFHLDS